MPLAQGSRDPALDAVAPRRYVSAESDYEGAAALEFAVACLRGAVEVTLSPAGAIPRRLTAEAVGQIGDAWLDSVTQMPAGVRLELTTDATWIELQVQLTMFEIDDRPLTPAMFDVVVDGRPRADGITTTTGTVIVADTRTGSVDFKPGGPATVRIDDLPGQVGTRVEVWLPHSAMVELLDLRIADGATAEATPNERPRWVHYGSSISHDTGVSRPIESWPVAAARAASVSLYHLGLAGQCNLDPCVARIIRDLPVDVISAKIGINVLNGDTMRERTFLPLLHGFIDTIREGHPTTPFVLASPIYCAVIESHPGPTAPGNDGVVYVSARTEALSRGALTLERVRELIEAVVEQRRSNGDSNLHYLDGLELFGQSDAADLPDGLHPNADGSQRLGRRFRRAVFGPGRPFSHVVAGEPGPTTDTDRQP